MDPDPDAYPDPSMSIIYLQDANKKLIFVSVADPDTGSGAFLTPGSGIRKRFFADHIFKSFLTIVLVKSSIIL